MLWKVLCCVYVTFGVINLITAANIPSYIHICHRDDPKVSACIKNSVNALLPRLKHGIPELDVPNLEPLRIDNILLQRSYGNFNFSLNVTEVDIYGAVDFVLNKLKLDVPNMTYKISVTFPHLRLVGKFEVDTLILSLPIKSKGEFKVNATNTEGTGILKGNIFHGPEFDHMIFTDLDIHLVIHDYLLRLDNISDGDQTLNEAMNELVNSNKDELIKWSTPFIESKTSETLLHLANKIVNNLEYDKAFPK